MGLGAGLGAGACAVLCGLAEVAICAYAGAPLVPAKATRTAVNAAFTGKSKWKFSLRQSWNHTQLFVLLRIRFDERKRQKVGPSPGK
jgi:hypothetical protein